MNNNEDMESLFNSLSKIDKDIIIMNIMLEMMASKGYKPAKIQILQNEITDLIQYNIMEKYIIIYETNEEILNQTEAFFQNIKEQIIDFSDKLLNKGE